MSLFDKLTGTRRPSGEAVPRSPEEVRRGLLEVNGPDVPYVVRPGAVDEAELVAEWRIRDPAWHSFFARVQASQVLLIRMRLVPERHEVRALDQQWDVTWVGDTPGLAVAKEQTLGQVTTSSRHWTVERGTDGRLRKTEVFRFNSTDLKTPLQEAVVGAGWTWRGAVFKL